MKECKRIAEGTCKKCSACGDNCECYIPEDNKKENTLGYGYSMCRGKVVDLIPNGVRYYMNQRCFK